MTLDQKGQVYCTADMPVADRFDYWRDAICDAYVHLDCLTENRAAFNGRISMGHLSSLRLSYVTGSAQHVRRRRKDIARETEEFFLVSIQLTGTGRVIQQEREAVISPGDFSLYSSSEPYDLVFGTDFDQLVIQVPKQLILEQVPVADMLTGIPVDGHAGTGKLVSDSLCHMANDMGSLFSVSGEHISSAVVSLISGGLNQVSGTGTRHLGQQNLMTSLRIEAFLASNIKNPDLTRSDVAAAMNMSVRRINELLAERGSSITRRIYEKRLENIYRDLKDPVLQREQISAIAMKWGFNNLQHFSRAFKKKYDCSPRNFRASAEGGRDRKPPGQR